MIYSWGIGFVNLVQASLCYNVFILLRIQSLRRLCWCIGTIIKTDHSSVKQMPVMYLNACVMTGGESLIANEQLVFKYVNAN